MSNENLGGLTAFVNGATKMAENKNGRNRSYSHRKTHSSREEFLRTS